MTTQPGQRSHAKVVTIVMTVFIAVAVAVFYFGIFPNHQKIDASQVKIDGFFLPHPQAINNFHLTDNSGKPFSKDNLKGHWTLVFFGFTNCGDVCPTTLSELNKMYKTLQGQLPDPKLPQVVMITVDAPRDSLEKLNTYVKAFNPHFIGLRGEEDELKSLEKQLHVTSVKMQAPGQGKNHYMVNHSAEVMVFNPQADLIALLSYPHEAEQMVSDYKTILAVHTS
jgi:protein SCO1